ncbi:uncharacterized protein VTP21DRAFT_3219 [Calcarisporiella thermophila]|uniref:uncharacterized protein n=1 Tax=Calcarisporiella thermophila TaxID=911321 RepID=UPI003742815A
MAIPLDRARDVEQAMQEGKREQEEIASRGSSGRVPVGSQAARFQSQADQVSEAIRQTQYPTEVTSGPELVAEEATLAGEQGVSSPDAVVTEKEEQDCLRELKRVAKDESQRLPGLSQERGSAAAKAQSAFGKYTSAVATEHGVSPQEVAGSVRPAPKGQVDVDELAAYLKQEASDRLSYEQLMEGQILKGTPASKVQSAADRLSQVAEMEKGR